MATGISALLLVGILTLSPSAVNFDALQLGAAPRGWTVTPMGTGKHSRWRVKSDPTAPSRGNVLERSAGGPEEQAYPVAVFDPVVCRDGDLSVKFRIDPSGSGRTAGVVWRYQDPQNYYLLDFTLKKIQIYRVQNGVREGIRIRGLKTESFAMPRDVAPGQWHLARVSFRGDRIKVYFGNRRLFEAEDAGLLLAGKTGVLTSRATVASFDDFRIEKKS